MDETGTGPARTDARAPDEVFTWPLVDRRQREGSGPAGVERRRHLLQPEPPLEVRAPALWPLRALAVAGAIGQAWDTYGRLDGGWRAEGWWAIAGTVVVVAVAAWTIARPVPYRDDASTRRRAGGELAVHTAVAVATGAWTSPFALCLIPSGMLAGFAAGTWFAARAVGAVAILLSVQHVADAGTSDAVRTSLLWSGLLGLVAFTSGYSHRAALEAARAQRAALVRVGRLAEANSLLSALQRIARSMPASLDLDDVVDTTFARLGALVPEGTVALYLFNDAEQQLERYRWRGPEPPAAIAPEALPAAARSAVEGGRTVRLARIGPGEEITPGARSGVYTALRARGAVSGVLVLEAAQELAFTEQHGELVHGLAESFAIAVDNAVLFRQLRTVSAAQERGRIARDLHDQVGSSLAFLGFEIDRARAAAERGGEVGPILDELRAHLTDVIGHIRETLHDLRTEVGPDQDLGATLREHAERVGRRSGLAVRCDVRTDARLPRHHERELWRIALEAITNVERHAQARQLDVALRVAHDHARLAVRDDGVGLNVGRPRADGYGMLGMRERADAIGARIRIESRPGGGTAVTVDLPVGVEVPR